MLKILTIVLVNLVFFAVVATAVFAPFTEEWRDIERASEILCRRAAEIGRDDIIMAQIASCRSKETASRLQAYLLASYLKSGNMEAYGDTLEKFKGSFDVELLDFLKMKLAADNPSFGKKDLYQGILALAGLPEKFDYILSVLKASVRRNDECLYSAAINEFTSLMKYSDKVIASEYSLDAVACALLFGDMQSLKNILAMTRYSMEKVIFIIGLAKDKNAEAMYADIAKNTDYRHLKGCLDYHSLLQSDEKIIQSVEFSKNYLRYAPDEFATRMSWLSTSINRDTKLNLKVFALPILGFIAETLGYGNDAEKFYREAFSPENLHAVRNNYFEYVNYSSIILSKKGDGVLAVNLLDTLYPPFKAAKSIRMASRRISEDDKALWDLSDLIIDYRNPAKRMEFKLSLRRSPVLFPR